MLRETCQVVVDQPQRVEIAAELAALGDRSNRCKVLRSLGRLLGAGSRQEQASSLEHLEECSIRPTEEQPGNSETQDWPQIPPHCTS